MGSKRKVKENHDSHQFSKKAPSNNTKKDDTKEENETKNIDHEGSKQKVKENHDSHQTRYKKAIVNTIKNDDIEKRNKKIIIQKNLRELTLWRPRSEKTKDSSRIKEEKSKEDDTKEKNET